MNIDTLIRLSQYDTATITGFVIVAMTLITLLIALILFVFRPSPFKPEFDIPGDELLSWPQRIIYETAGWTGSFALSLLYYLVLKVLIHIFSLQFQH